MKMTPVDRGQDTEGVNKYGSRKVWDGENKTGKPFVSADDSMAYVSTTKTAMFNPRTEEPEVDQSKEETVDAQEPTEEATRYQKVDYKKRYDDLKRHYDERIREFKKEKAQLQEQANSRTPVYKPPATPEELEDFKKENPQMYALVESIAHLRSSNEASVVHEELETVKQKLARVEAEKAYALLKSQVPDYEEIRTSDDFHDWAEEQPKEIQDWIYENRTNVDLAVKAIRLYKADRGVQESPKATTQQEPPVSPSPEQPGADSYIPSRGGSEEPAPGEKVWLTSEIASLSTAQYEKYRNEIDRAFAEGRVKRDTK